MWEFFFLSFIFFSLLRWSFYFSLSLPHTPSILTNNINKNNKRAQMSPTRNKVYHHISSIPLNSLTHSLIPPSFLIAVRTAANLIQYPPQRLKDLAVLPLLPSDLHRLHHERVDPRKMLPVL